MGECAHLSGRRSSQLGRSRPIDLHGPICLVSVVPFSYTLSLQTRFGLSRIEHRRSVQKGTGSEDSGLAARSL